MKKIVSILIASIFFTTSAFAGGLVGVKFGQGELEATKKSVVNVTPSPDDVGETNSIDNIYGAIFAEVNLNESPVNLGFELVPLTGTVSVVNDDSDASVELSNLKTIYALAAKELDNGASVYAKIGYSHADIDNAKQSSGNNTINSFDDHVLIDLKLHQNVYVYSDKLNFTISPENKNLKVETESLVIKDEFFGESEVFINNIFFNVPNLKDGILSFKLNYLGCYQGKYCYPEKNNKIDLLFKENRLISKKIL